MDAENGSGNQQVPDGRWTRWCPQTPTEKQREFIDHPGGEVMFGGRAGPGKSSALLMRALKHVDVPGYSALLLRRTFSDLALPGAIMDRAHEWLADTGAVWNERDKYWSFPVPNGKRPKLTFGYCDTARAHYRYQGAEVQYVGIDELTQWPEYQYTYLFSRLRRLETMDVPLCMGSATNPGGVGHEWVKARFVDDETRAEGAVYIPAGLADNPHVGADYKEMLAKLDPVTRRQLERGDWDAVEAGEYFDRVNMPVLDEPPGNIVTQVRFYDMAATEASAKNKDPDFTVGVKLGGCFNQITGVRSIGVLDVLRGRWSPHGTEEQIKATAAMDGRIVPVRMEEEGGSSGKTVISHYDRRVLPAFDFQGVRSTGDKIIRAQPVSAAVAQKQVWVLRAEWNAQFLSELEQFPLGGHDDQVDAFAGAYNELAATGWGTSTAGHRRPTKSTFAGSRGKRRGLPV